MAELERNWWLDDLGSQHTHTHTHPK